MQDPDTVPFAKDCDEFLRLQADAEIWKPFPEQVSAMGTLLVDDGPSIAQVAHDMVAPVLLDATNEDSMCRLWNMLFEAVSQLPQYNDKLVNLVVEIQKLEYRNDYGLIFTTLPFFRRHFTEYGSPFSADVPRDAVDFEVKRQVIVNNHAFLEKLNACEVPALSQIGRGGEAAPWENIEDDYDPNSLDSYEQQLEQNDVRTLDGLIPGAVQWIKYAGVQMYNKRGTFQSDHRYPDHKWDGPLEWSKERFAF